MPRRSIGHEIRFLAKISVAVLCLMGGASRADDVPDVDPAGVADPIERMFYQELRELRQRQILQRQELSSRDLSPDERLEKRRALLIQSHRELQALEASYQSKLSPEARTRWMERKASREKRFDKLHRKPGSGEAPLRGDSGKGPRRKSP